MNTRDQEFGVTIEIAGEAIATPTYYAQEVFWAHNVDFHSMDASR